MAGCVAPLLGTALFVPYAREGVAPGRADKFRLVASPAVAYAGSRAALFVASWFALRRLLADARDAAR